MSGVGKWKLNSLHLLMTHEFASHLMSFNIDIKYFEMFTKLRSISDGQNSKIFLCVSTRNTEN